MPVPAYIELCRDVYFSIDEYADTDFIIANSGLYYLFTEHFCPTDNEDLRKQYFVWGRLCRDAMMQAVGSLTVCLPAHIKSVQALVLGVSIPSFDHLRRTADNHRPLTPSNLLSPGLPGASFLLRHNSPSPQVFTRTHSWKVTT